MKKFQLHTDTWIDADLDDQDEASTFAQLRIAVGTDNLTRNLNSRNSTTSTSINVPLLPLAQFIARNWWSVLYEPVRSGAGDVFRARHRLDIPMHGYIFPRMALCSGGDQTVLTAWAKPSGTHSPIEFLVPASVTPEILAREQVEDVLLELVQIVLDRLNKKGPAFADLAASWDRLKGSLGDKDEYGYCKIAGKLGLDPYDPTGPDLTLLMSKVSETLLEDVSDAVFLEELLPATEWVAEHEQAWKAAPEIDVASFGKYPQPDAQSAAWELGHRAANIFRQNTGAPASPRKHLEQVLGEVLVTKSATFNKAPRSISALIARKGGKASVATVARSAREQRFKACTAAYIAWASNPGEERIATTAFTRHQQASRAFAAELLAPVNYLKDKSPKHGLLADDIEDIAGDLICPYDTVLWQAFHAGIPLRGVEISTPQYPSIV